MAAASIERQAVSVHQTAPLAQLDAKLSMHGHPAASKVSRQACSDRLGQMPMQHRCAPEFVPFEGNFDELVRLCRAVAPGSVIDLQGAAVQHTNNVRPFSNTAPAYRSLSCDYQIAEGRAYVDKIRGIASCVASGDR